MSVTTNIVAKLVYIEKTCNVIQRDEEFEQLKKRFQLLEMMASNAINAVLQNLEPKKRLSQIRTAHKAIVTLADEEYEVGTLTSKPAVLLREVSIMSTMLDDMSNVKNITTWVRGMLNYSYQIEERILELCNIAEDPDDIRISSQSSIDVIYKVLGAPA